MSPAEQEFRAAVARKKAAGMSHDKAVISVNREQPHLVEQMRQSGGQSSRQPGQQSAPVAARSTFQNSTIDAFKNEIDNIMAEAEAAGRPISRSDAAMKANRKRRFFV